RHGCYESPIPGWIARIERRESTTGRPPHDSSYRSALSPGVALAMKDRLPERGVRRPKKPAPPRTRPPPARIDISHRTKGPGFEDSAAPANLRELAVPALLMIARERTAPLPAVGLFQIHPDQAGRVQSR